MKTLQFLLLTGAAFGIGASVAASCVPVYRTISFRCSPRGPSPQCPKDQTCCSDDAAAEQGGLPDYRPGGDPTPFFAGQNNGQSARGMCIRTADLDPGAGLQVPANCPVPCNPSWSDVQIADICGGNSVCCQTTELGAKDCVSYNDNDIRPVSGQWLQEWRALPENQMIDPRTVWTQGAFDTHQDPGLEGCIAFAGPNEEALNDCLTRLTAADQRGFCMAAIRPDGSPTTCYQDLFGSGEMQCEGMGAVPQG